MMALHAQRGADQVPDHLLLLQHEPVITKGRRLHGQPIPFQKKIEAQGIQVRDADRGGQLTYHGPGQLVIYFVIRFSDHFEGVADMVHSIENELLRFLKTKKIEGRVDSEHPGIWVGQKKVASIGLRVSDGVTRHGISLNVNNDLSVYQLFDPCGMSGQNMTHLQEILGREFSDEEVWDLGRELAHCFGEALKN